MSQICYKELIIGELLKSPRYIRAISRSLNTNQMTIYRKAKELEDENVLDYRQEGKTKVYFLKKTLETRHRVLMFEHYMLLHTLQKYPLLRNVFQKVTAHPRVRLALLFGSYAKGTAHKDSDIDIYIETTDGRLKKDIELLNSKVKVKIGLYNPANLLIKEIEKNHVIIKGGERFYEKCRIFC